MPESIRIVVEERSQTAEARRVARGMAEKIGLDQDEAERVAIVVTEACTNLLKHASGGEILVRSTGEDGQMPSGTRDPGSRSGTRNGKSQSVHAGWLRHGWFSGARGWSDRAALRRVRLLFGRSPRHCAACPMHCPGLKRERQRPRRGAANRRGQRIQARPGGLRGFVGRRAK